MFLSMFEWYLTTFANSLQLLKKGVVSDADKFHKKFKTSFAIELSQKSAGDVISVENCILSEMRLCNSVNCMDIFWFYPMDS